ncbi:MAG: hypothetical protein NWR03_08380 [Akkermansiaceae bacterium]|nr:hypothetical protein [Akkermansiaceae bacterium]MDP4779080.1 hypothetical protein [Akkermansiaceae bacterium]MDP4897777.1 hypothetical protein [Akkermansiaceae bacterium]MDP4996668.1 hypothetical protein [Akkermansiaceae bacterium]
MERGFASRLLQAVPRHADAKDLIRSAAKRLAKPRSIKCHLDAGRKPLLRWTIMKPIAIITLFALFFWRDVFTKLRLSKKTPSQ